MENTAMTLLVPSPVAMEIIPSIYALRFLRVLSESGKQRLKKGRKSHTRMVKSHIAGHVRRNTAY